MKTPQDSPQRQPSVKNTRRVKKPLAKPVGSNQPLLSGQPKPHSSHKINPQPLKSKSRLQGCLVTLGSLALLLTASGVIVGGIWLAILLMVNPNAVVWLNQYLPQWTRIPVSAASPPKTLEAIQQEVRQSDLIPGEALFLSKNGIDEGSTALLLPILKSPPACQLDCEQIVELRVYQPIQPGFYQLATQLEIAGPEEYFVLSSLLNTQVDQATESRSLPLTKISRFDDKAPEPGFWFNLSNQRLSGDTPMTYGQVVHYNPEQMHLSVMLQWTTPNEQSASWQQVTGDAKSEFVVNQTVGLEPRFKVYQLRPRNFVPNPIVLEEISLIQPALDSPVFRNALLLARHGLWSPALELLQSQKKNNGSATAQAQMDLIQLHAQVTQSQAKQAWANPSSAILAKLIDGRWADALLMFQSFVPGVQAQDIVTLIQTDSDSLLDRVETALKVNPDSVEVKAWGALIVAVKQGRLKAIAWLGQFSQNSKTKPVNYSSINELLDRLDTFLGKKLPSNRHVSRIIGTAQPVLNVNPADWLQPGDLNGEQGAQEQASPNATTTPGASTNSPDAENLATLSPTPPFAQTSPTLQLEPLKVWYQVQVSAFHDGARWWQAPFSNWLLPNSVSAQQMWNYLGLGMDSQIQITVWNAEGRQEGIMATVKAVSFKGGSLQLLAAGDVLPTFKTADAAVKSSLLAYTDAALEWIEPSSVTLSSLNEVQPEWVSALLPTLRRELVNSGHLKSGALPSDALLLKEMGQWSVRLVELTGNNKPDAVFTLYEDRIFGALKRQNDNRIVENPEIFKPRTLIFADDGLLLYSEFSQDANTSLTAIADLGDGSPGALVLSGNNSYSLKRWSSENQRFE
ncbi:hypothetical protein [Allocoleopsis franciscana]|uniref:hypothetical protein n=1 Tax=Allocoleopsis franciscana TaxID=2886352 RepID=UPI0006858211|nr:hypothetical protein [Allocoleopsis franciscana]